jgi:hypothetical protein
MSFKTFLGFDLFSFQQDRRPRGVKYPDGGGAGGASDVLRHAFLYFHSMLRRKVVMTPMTVERIAIPMFFAISYRR